MSLLWKRASFTYPEYQVKLSISYCKSFLKILDNLILSKIPALHMKQNTILNNSIPLSFKTF